MTKADRDEVERDMADIDFRVRPHCIAADDKGEARVTCRECVANAVIDEEIARYGLPAPSLSLQNDIVDPYFSSLGRILPAGLGL
jgi:alkanesulfonate monooxygenase SsuD/methylene tetrahydromethanopterin reductase-like flavin-dependent oxidoreductase (luciferase family)